MAVIRNNSTGTAQTAAAAATGRTVCRTGHRGCEIFDTTVLCSVPRKAFRASLDESVRLMSTHPRTTRQQLYRAWYTTVYAYYEIIVRLRKMSQEHIQLYFTSYPNIGCRAGQAGPYCSLVVTFQ